MEPVRQFDDLSPLSFSDKEIYSNSDKTSDASEDDVMTVLDGIPRSLVNDEVKETGFGESSSSGNQGANDLAKSDENSKKDNNKEDIFANIGDNRGGSNQRDNNSVKSGKNSKLNTRVTSDITKMSENNSPNQHEGLNIVEGNIQKGMTMIDSPGTETADIFANIDNRNQINQEEDIFASIQNRSPGNKLAKSSENNYKKQDIFANIEEYSGGNQQQGNYKSMGENSNGEKLDTDIFANFDVKRYRSKLKADASKIFGENSQQSNVNNEEIQTDINMFSKPKTGPENREDGSLWSCIKGSGDPADKNKTNKHKQKISKRKRTISAKEGKKFEPNPVIYRDQLKLYNPRYLPPEAETYELEKFQKKTLIIFNQSEIVDSEKREGTDKDAIALKNTFEKCGFYVREFVDLPKDAIFGILDYWCGKADLLNHGCIAVAVLTHGSTQGVLWAADQKYSERDILDYFKVYKNPILVTKPIILIIQACRGYESTKGFTVVDPNIHKDNKNSGKPYTLPLDSDTIVLHSSYIGVPSFRHKKEGSWFIQELCKHIDKLRVTHDLESIMTEVKKEVAINKCHWVNSEDINGNGIKEAHKQMPTVTSTLIRKLYLRKYNEVFPAIHILGGVIPEVQVSNDVLDVIQSRNYDVTDSAVRAAPPTVPLQLKFGSCSCFLDQFERSRNYMSKYVDEHPCDETARDLSIIASYLGVQNIDSTHALERIMQCSTEATMSAINNYLANHSRDYNSYKLRLHSPRRFIRQNPRPVVFEYWPSMLQFTKDVLLVGFAGYFIYNFIKNGNGRTLGEITS